MATALDRCRPFGSITPLYKDVAAYEQDGRYFGPDGQRVRLPDEVDDEPVPAPKAAAVTPAHDEPQPVVRKGRGGRPKGSTSKEKASAAAKPVVADPAIEGDVNLTTWATGDADYIMADVYKAIRARLNINVTNEADAIDALIDAGIVSSGQAKRG